LIAKFYHVLNVAFFLWSDSPSSEFYLHRCCKQVLTSPMKMKQEKCSETLAHKIQTPKNYPKKEYKIRLDWGCLKHLNVLLSENEGF